MTSTPTIDAQKLIEIAKQQDIAYLAIFGSVARAEAHPDSDVDVYVRFGRAVGLFEMLAVKHAMEDALGCSVDLIAEEVVKPYQFVRDGMAQDLLVLYEKSSEYDATAQ